MENEDEQMKSTLQGRDGRNFYRKTAITIGVIYLAGMVVGIPANILIQSIMGTANPLASISANSTLVAIGALLWLLAGVVVDAAHGILMFPILKRYSERIAFGYFGARIMDAVFVGVMLNYVLYRAKLLPRVLAVWGLVGYAVILCGSVLEVLGFNLMLIHTLPGGLWEVLVGG